MSTVANPFDRIQCLPPVRMVTALYRIAEILDLWLSRFLTVVSIIALPLSALLFIQWPLREIVQAYSREANDLAQALFAVYVSLAITAATRLRTHLAADLLGHYYSAHVRRILYRAASLLVLVPWSGFILWTAWSSTWQSIFALERFPETYNPGYFLVKGAIILLTLAVLLQSLIEGIYTHRGSSR